MRTYLRALDLLVVAAAAMRDGNVEQASMYLHEAASDPTLERTAQVVLSANKKKKKVKKKAKASLGNRVIAELAVEDASIDEDAAELTANADEMAPPTETAVAGGLVDDDDTVGQELRTPIKASPTELSKVTAALVARQKAQKALAAYRILAAEAGGADDEEDEGDDDGEETAAAIDGPRDFDSSLGLTKLTPAPGAAANLDSSDTGADLKVEVKASAMRGAGGGDDRQERLRRQLANLAATSALGGAMRGRK